jgi:hypothetical protein
MRGSRTTTGTTTGWLVWIPVLMVASLIYWTVALGLGGMSLMEVSSLSGSVNDGPLGVSVTDSDGTVAAPPRDGYEPIIVHLEESVEPEDVDDNTGCGLSGGSTGADAESEAESAANHFGHLGPPPPSAAPSLGY